MPLLCKLDACLNGLYRFAGALAALCLVGMAGFVVVSIVARLLGLYVGGATQYSAYLMGAANCLGLAYTFRHGGHIRVTLLADRLSIRGQHILEIFCLAVAAAASAYLAWYLVSQAYISYDFGDVSEGADQMKLWIPQSVIAVGAIILAIATLHTFLSHVAGMVCGKPQWLSTLMVSEEKQLLDQAKETNHD
ncbi:TRAP transporter small permease [Pokkaliibacter sp. CJK22405]|uniref:TRAP transporter small permease n=1 Tax=Pokkaliibacter sp. CJK22405 TaxID=3384615 RepID=UPI0039852816